MLQSQQDDYGKLQTLGSVHRHDAHRVVVCFRGGNIGDASPLSLLHIGPLEKRVQSQRGSTGVCFTGILQLTGLLTKEPAAAPNLPGSVFRKIQLLKAHFAQKFDNDSGHSCGLPQLVIGTDFQQAGTNWKSLSQLECFLAPFLPILIEKDIFV